MQGLPTHEDVVGGLTLKDLDQFRPQMLCVGETAIGTFYTVRLVAALTVDPVAEIGVDQLLERPLALTVRGGETVVVDERMEAVSPTVPDMPDEGTLLENRAVLCEESVAQPVFK